MGRKIFGNTVGIMNNIRGIQGKKKSLRKEYKNKQSEFARNEYLALGQPYDKLLMHEIKLKFQKMIEDDRYSRIGPQYDGKVYMRDLNEPEKDIPEITKLLTPDLVEELNAYYHGYFRVNRITAWRNYGIPKSVDEKKELLSNRWHCDYRVTYYTKLFVNISDVGEDDGPFHIFSRNQTKKIMKQGFKNRFDYGAPHKLLEDEKHVFKAVGPSGTACLANTELCLHRAGTPSEGHYRDVIQLRFGPSKKPLNSEWIKDVPNWKEVQKLRELKQGIND